MRIKAVGYTRTSKGGPQRRHASSTERQRSSIVAWCEAHSAELVTTFSDVSVTGAVGPEKRPALRAALNAVRDGKAEVVVVESRDRLARDVAVAEAVEKEVASHGGRIESADFGCGNGEGPEARMTSMVHDALDRYDIERSSELYGGPPAPVRGAPKDVAFIRVPPGTTARAEALRPLVARAYPVLVRVTRSMVFRVALLRALDEMERTATGPGSSSPATPAPTGATP